VTEVELNHALIAKIVENEELKRLVVDLWRRRRDGGRVAWTHTTCWPSTVTRWSV
jgi:hypothetical protein